MIISHESLLGYHFYNFDDLKTNFNAMEKLFNKPNYLILFREQYEFLYSLWLHRVRKGIKKSFGEFVSNKKIENYNIKKSKNFLTNYKVYDFNTIFEPYLQILRKRAYFLNVKKISNEKYFNEIISLFVKKKMLGFWKKN